MEKDLFYSTIDMIGVFLYTCGYSPLRLLALESEPRMVKEF